MKIDITKLDFKKMNGLVPAIIQDAKTLEILMLGFMNTEALTQTIKTGKVTFFSRSKGRLWLKGESSGNFLEVTEIRVDCDNDSLLIMANPIGPTCHTGQSSCFGKAPFNLAKLYRLISDRKEKMPTDSYTTSLFKEGREAILAKIDEESAEVIQAARREGKQRLIEESCDLLYHLLVLLSSEEISMEEINEELGKRQK